ncbi:MAG: hypothetical protein ACI31S_05995 [Bacilli bacterium]
MNNLLKKKRKLEKVIERDCNECSYLAFFLIHTGKLDNVINLLDDKVTIPDTTCLVKRGFLTSEEQFVDVLEYVIRIINSEFWFLVDKNTIIEAILNFDSSLNLLLSKNYIGNNKYIEFYEIGVKKICIFNFYNVLKFIDQSELVEEFLVNHEIDLNSFDIESNNDIIKLFKVLKLIAICNYNSYHLLYLFNNRMSNKNKKMFEIQVEILIEKTNERELKAMDILNDFC